MYVGWGYSDISAWTIYYDDPININKHRVMQYTLTLTQRMVAIIAICFCFLCILLFLLGVEIGKRYSVTPPVPVTVPVLSVPIAPPTLPAVVTPPKP